jgi:hypothetical protein
MQAIAKSGFVEPTPIQSQGWPMALKGRDLIGIAQTGSGKTLSYLLPGLVHVGAQPRLGLFPINLLYELSRFLTVSIALLIIHDCNACRTRRWPNCINPRPHKRTGCSNTGRIYKIWIIFKN